MSPSQPSSQPVSQPVSPRFEPSSVAPAAAPVVIRRASAGPAARLAMPAALIACLLSGLGISPAHAGRSAAVPDDRSGGTVHVCVDARGQREFRDMPCAPHQRSLRAIAFERVPVASTPQVLARETASAIDRRNAAAHARAIRRAAAPVSTRAAGHARKAPDACARARMQRDDAHQRASSGLGFDQWRRLDREVWLHCRNG